MLAKRVAIGLVMSGLMAGTALAQSTAPSSSSSPSMSPSASSTMTRPASGEWRTSKLIGVNVYNDSNEKLGSISELITDKQGKINKVVIGVGGFLGVGQHDIAVNFDQLKFTDTPIPSTVSSAAPSSAPGSASSSAPGASGSSTVGAAGSTSSSTSSSTMSRSSADHWYPDHAVMSATKDQLKAMPEFSYDSASK